MKVSEWKTYRTRFLVKAKQLNSSLTFTDHLGRQHCGRKGDYLVESFDGVLSIAPRRIFEDIYVTMPGSPDIAGDAAEPSSSHQAEFNPGDVRPLDLHTVRLEPLVIERIKPAAFEYEPRDSKQPHTDVVRTRRKSLMSVPSAAARVRLM